MLPNVMTYGVLALSCRTKQEALELIDDMLMHKYRYVELTMVNNRSRLQ